jgi:hypothetical protein
MKPVAIGLVVLFLGFWMVQEPDSLAAFVKDGSAWLWDTTTLVFEALMEFVSGLFE